MVTAGSLPTETQSVSSDTHNLSTPARTLARAHTHTLSEAQPGPQALITKALTDLLRENSSVGRQHLHVFFLATLPSDYDVHSNQQKGIREVRWSGIIENKEVRICEREGQK